MQNELESRVLESDDEPTLFLVNRTKKHGRASVEKPGGMWVPMVSLLLVANVIVVR